MMEVFNDYAYYYNLFYQDKDYDAETEQIVELLNRYGQSPKGSSMLSLGCGTGKHDFALSKLGFSMTGIDISPVMIKMALDSSNDHADPKPPLFEVADIREYQPHCKYDNVISLFHVVSYQNKNADLLKTFETASKALNSGGLFIFDVWYGPGVLSDKPAVRIKRVTDGNNLLIRYAQPVMSAEDNCVEVNYEILIIDQISGHVSKIEEQHSMRYFFQPEIEFMLDQKGLSLLACVDCNTLKATDYNSWTAYFIARKK
ncbi:MAG: methyltransferase domain-containing protein [Lachnospiraceae bacterium]|jgi:SAM-dependent methyltransferase|nr:methyltransferase domain-containing protein [Lachnospiraceae bacterium]